MNRICLFFTILLLFASTQATQAQEKELPLCSDDFKPHSRHSLSDTPTNIEHLSSRQEKGMNHKVFLIIP